MQPTIVNLTLLMYPKQLKKWKKSQIRYCTKVIHSSMECLLIMTLILHAVMIKCHLSSRSKAVQAGTLWSTLMKALIRWRNNKLPRVVLTMHKHSSKEVKHKQQVELSLTKMWAWERWALNIKIILTVWRCILPIVVLQQ